MDTLNELNLYFKGTEKELNDFAKEIRNYVNDDWKYVEPKENETEYLSFDYVGDKFTNVRLRIDIWNAKKGIIEVICMITLRDEDPTIDIDEYNNILNQFYKDIIQPYEENPNTSLCVIGPTY